MKKYLKILLLTSLFVLLFAVSASAEPLTSVTSHKHWICINFKDSNGNPGTYACGWDSDDGLVIDTSVSNSYAVILYNTNSGSAESITYHYHMKDSFEDDSGQAQTLVTNYKIGIYYAAPYKVTSNCVIFKTAEDLVNNNTANAVYTPNGSKPSEVIPSDWGTPPARSSYADGIIGDVEYGFDTFIYYVTIPFKMLASAVTQIVSAVGIALTSLSSLQGFLMALFNFLPAGISSLLVVAVGLLVVGLVLRVFRR